jgi:hypothetical protein
VADKSRFQGIETFIVIFDVFIKPVELGPAETIFWIFQVFTIRTFRIQVAFLIIKLFAQSVDRLEILDLVRAFVLQEFKARLLYIVLFLDQLIHFREALLFFSRAGSPLCTRIAGEPYEAK